MAEFKRKMDDIFNQMIAGLEVIGKIGEPEDPKKRQERLVEELAKGFLDSSLDAVLNGTTRPTSLMDATVNYPGLLSNSLNLLYTMKRLKEITGNGNMQLLDRSFNDALARVKGFKNWEELEQQSPETVAELKERVLKLSRFSVKK